jgi:hypothetical protein
MTQPLSAAASSNRKSYLRRPTVNRTELSDPQNNVNTSDIGDLLHLNNVLSDSDNNDGLFHMKDGMGLPA